MSFTSIRKHTRATAIALLVIAGISCLAPFAVAQELFGSPVTPLSILDEQPAMPVVAASNPLPEAIGPLETEQPLFATSPIMVGLPSAQVSPSGLVVRPEIQLGRPTIVGSAEMDVRWFQTQRPSAEGSTAQQFVSFQEQVPPPLPQPPTPNLSIEPAIPLPIEPVFEGVVQASPGLVCRPTLWQRWLDPCPGTGIGQERLPFSLFEIDPAQPFNNLRIRAMIARRMHLPDRAEYFWQRTVDRRGPARGESLMDFQEGHLRMELGSKKFSSAFDVPLRATNPELNPNHAGLGDMSVAVKTVMLDGETWLISQQFTSYFPTGSSTMGLGRGKVAMEPGLLLRNRWNDRTWMHSQIKFWFPIAADPQHSGQVLNLATGFNRVLWETDTRSLVPSLEFSNYSVLNGLARDAAGTLRRVDGDNMFYITPGMHYAFDGHGDFGLFELGSGVSIATTNQRFTDSTWMFDVRWSW